MKISDIISKKDQQRFELCQHCTRLTHEQKIQLDKNIKVYKEVITELKEDNKRIAYSAKLNNDVLKEMDKELKLEKKHNKIYAKREKYLEYRIRKLYGEDAYNKLLNTVECPKMWE